MAVIRGQKEHEKFEVGTRLTYRQTLLAMCYICNGGKEGGVDCQGDSCPGYPYMPYRGKRGTRARWQEE